MRITSADAGDAVRHLSKADPRLKAVIKSVGPFTLKVHRNRFWMLVRSIASQQLSSAAARTIVGRLEALLDGSLTPESIVAAPADQLRATGLSTKKVEFIQELADAVQSGRLNLRTLGRRPDADVIEQLIEHRGIGTWTAQMFLIFALGRLNVFPIGDAGVRAVIRSLHGLSESAGIEEYLAIGERWNPYSTVGSWYCWRSIDLRIALPRANGQV